MARFNSSFALAGALLASSVTLLAARSASAQTFAEDWESGSGAWRTTDASAITLQSDAAICSSTYERETVLASGGHLFTQNPIPVVAGQAYCLVSWVRGSASTQPFLGINYSNAGGAVGQEHWLIGNTGYTDGYGGTVTAVTADGAWHWYSKAFSLGAGVSYLLIKSEIFQGGSAGSADFDDIRLYQGACPAAPVGADHVACSGATPICDAGKCVECASNADCGGATPICDATSHVCRACTGNADCGGSTPACATGGANAGMCVECTIDGDCGAGTPRCDTTSNSCVACLGAADCGGTTPVCDATAATCRACASDGECGGSTPACESSGACGQCSASNTSQCSGATSACDTASGTCVGCVSNADCGGATPVCDTTAHTCGPCLSNADCGGATPVCATGGSHQGECVVCAADSDCGGAAPRCDATSATCVACLSNADCGGATPICGVTLMCRACAGNSDCGGSTPACATSGSNAGVCVACTADSDCGGATPRCDTTQNQCVGCLGSADCSGATPVCDGIDGDLRRMFVRRGLRRFDPRLSGERRLRPVLGEQRDAVLRRDPDLRHDEWQLRRLRLECRLRRRHAGV